MFTAHADRNIRLLYAVWFLREFQLWIPVWVVFLVIERGFSLTQVTTAEGLYLAGVVALEVPTGAVADRWGRSRSMTLGFVTLGAAVLIFAFTTSFAILLTSFLLWSVAHTLMSGADLALLFDTLKASGREHTYERLAGRGHALEWTGAGIATLLGGPVAQLVDIRFTIFVGAATCLVAATVAFMLWEPPHNRGEQRAPYLQSIAAAAQEAWHAPDVRLVIFLGGMSMAGMAGAHYLLQPYLIDRGIEVGTTFSLLQLPMMVAGIGGALVSSRLLGHAGARVALVCLPATGVVAYIVLATMPGLTGYAALPLMFAMGSAMQPLATGYVNRRVGSENRATVLSMQGMVQGLALAAVAPGVGFATDQWGLDTAFALGGAMTLLAVVVFGLPLILTKVTAAKAPGLPEPADA